jgi:hypothetical protein
VATQLWINIPLNIYNSGNILTGVAGVKKKKKKKRKKKAL